MSAFPKHPGGGIDTPAANEARERDFAALAAAVVARMHVEIMPMLNLMRMSADEIGTDPRAGDLTLSEWIEQTEALCKTGFGDLEE